MTTEDGRRRRFHAFEGCATTLLVGDDPVTLWRVADLERHVDRHALLVGDDPHEPPYWAHLWSGATVLAEAVPRRAGGVLEIGCGLGLPGLVAARRGARVTFLDREPLPLAFVRASLADSGLGARPCVVGDFTRAPFRRAFDWVLGAEILYDRAAFGAIARSLADLVAPHGAALLTDASRIDTRAFYPLLASHGLRWDSSMHRVIEEGTAIDVRLVTVRHARATRSGTAAGG